MTSHLWYLLLWFLALKEEPLAVDFAEGVVEEFGKSFVISS